MSAAKETVESVGEQIGNERGSSLAGKTAVVTGASRGIGRAIALELATLGADLVVTARDQARLDDVSASIRKIGSRAEVVSGDLQQPDLAKKIVAAALKTFGNIDILINNAGATKRGDFLKLPDQDWIDGFGLKFFGAVWLSRSAWPHLAHRKGSIVNIAGFHGRTPFADFTIGGPVNAALLSLTKALAEIGLDDGVRVNCVNPGLIRTDRLTKRIEAASEKWGVSEAEAADRLQKEYRITQFGEPEDIAALVGFIVSERGRLFHGSLIDVDAGWTKTI